MHETSLWIGKVRRISIANNISYLNEFCVKAMFYISTPADIVVLDMTLLDITQFKDNLGTFIANFVLQILSWMAEKERERIRKRQREGINVALHNGVEFGRPKAKVTDKFIQVYSRGNYHSNSNAAGPF
jgi:hypothetical protein